MPGAVGAAALMGGGETLPDDGQQVGVVGTDLDGVTGTVVL